MMYSLTEIVRQHEDSPLLDLLSLLREDIINNSFKVHKYLRLNPSKQSSNGGYSKVNFNQFKDEMLKHFTSNEFKNNINYCRYAAYTNSSVDLWNKFIRTNLFPTKKLIVVGDILTSYKTIVDSNYSPVIINSNEYKVLNTVERISDDGFAVFHTELLDLTTETKLSVSIVDHTHDTFKEYYNTLNGLHRNAYYSGGAERGKRFKTYFQFKDTHLCMINFPLLDHKNAKPRGYVTKELSYGYAVTVHKLQGTTIENILIDGLDICYVKSNPITPRINTKYNPHAISLRNRLLYTGLSRASNKAIIMLEK